MSLHTESSVVQALLYNTSLFHGFSIRNSLGRRTGADSMGLVEWKLCVVTFSSSYQIMEFPPHGIKSQTSPWHMQHLNRDLKRILSFKLKLFNQYTNR